MSGRRGGGDSMHSLSHRSGGCTRRVAGLTLVGLGVVVGVLALRRGDPPQPRDVREHSPASPVVRSPQVRSPPASAAPSPADEAPYLSLPPAPSGRGVELECHVPGLVGTGFGVLVGGDGNPAPAPFEAGVFRAVVASREGGGIFRLAGNGEWEVSWRDDGGVVRCEVAPEAPTWGLQGRAVGWDAWPADTTAVVRGCDGLADIEPDGSFYLERRDPEPCALEVWLRAEGKLANGGPYPIGPPTTGADTEVELRLPSPSALRRMTDEEADRLEQRVELLARGCKPEEPCYRLVQQDRRQLELHRAAAGED